MGKFVGIIGFLVTEEKEPGLNAPIPKERSYRGDLLRNNVKREENPDSINDNINISNQISIVANPYAKEHIYEMKYLKFRMPKLGGVWKITNAEIQEPRIILTLGGVYSGVTLESSEKANRDSGQ